MEKIKPKSLLSIGLLLVLIGIFCQAGQVTAGDLYLSGVLSGGVYVDDNIITQNNCVIVAGTEVILIAHNSLILNPGFQVELGGKLITIFSQADDTDSDHDDLLDWWELSFFGNLVEERNADPDLDGVKNYLEFRLKTDPTDLNNVPEPGYFYEYDELGRLTCSIYLSVNYTNNYEIKYDYEDNGNRIKKTLLME